MHIKIYWQDEFNGVAVANLIDNSGVHVRTYEINPQTIKEFIDEYFEHRTRPVQPHPYWSRDSHIATLDYYLKRIEEALAEPDDAIKLANIKAIMQEYATPVAIA